jgi:hypothetical protein
MSAKTVACVISQDMVPTRPDALTPDCLRVECTSRVVLHPGTQTRINLCIHNSSSEGRMGHVLANFDSRQVIVSIPDASVYISADGKTTIFALVTAIAASGQASITFDVF